MTISDHSKFLVTTQAQTNEQHTSLLSLIGFVPYESANFFLTQKINESLSPNYLSVIHAQKKVFVRKVIELHDKYLAYVNDCFMNHSLFHKTLKEAFEVFCNKGVAGSSSAELLATFCDNILKKGGSEKLSDEAIEETLEKLILVFAVFFPLFLFLFFFSIYIRSIVSKFRQVGEKNRRKKED